jgi:hypothetical protein
MRIAASLPALLMFAFCMFVALAIPVHAQPQPAVVPAGAAVAAPLDRQHVVLLVSMALPVVALVLKRRKPLEHWIHGAWAIGLSALVAGALEAAAHAIVMAGLNAFAMISAVIVFLGTAAAMSSSTPAEDKGKLQIPGGPSLALVFVLALSGCGAQFREALKETKAAELQRAQATRKAVKDFRAEGCDQACKDRNLDLIDALAAVVAP